MLDSLKTKLISVCNTLIPNLTYLICESVSSFHFKMRAGVKYLFSPHHGSILYPPEATILTF